MKALTVQQPWAGLIAVGVKDVENRSRRTPYRGPLLIHAGVSRDREADLQRIGGAEPLCTARGVLLGTVELVDVVRDSASPWAVSGQWHWLLRGAVLLGRPVPCRGQLGLWDVVVDVEGVPA